MSDRLAELRRQRALLEEHLAWLDREIATEAKQVPAARTVPPEPVRRGLAAATTTDANVAPTLNVVAPTLAATTVPTHPAVPAPSPDVLFDQYRVAPDALKSDVRKGCFLYFTLALLFVGLGVAVLWMALRK